jgi:hypothetical protein
MSGENNGDDEDWKESMWNILQGTIHPSDVTRTKRVPGGGNSSIRVHKVSVILMKRTYTKIYSIWRTRARRHRVPKIKVIFLIFEPWKVCTLRQMDPYPHFLLVSSSRYFTVPYPCKARKITPHHRSSEKGLFVHTSLSTTLYTSPSHSLWQDRGF